jgi:tetratricopeptide (TPR) repeat protein
MVRIMDSKHTLTVLAIAAMLSACSVFHEKPVAPASSESAQPEVQPASENANVIPSPAEEPSAPPSAADGTPVITPLAQPATAPPEKVPAEPVPALPSAAQREPGPAETAPIPLAMPPAASSSATPPKPMTVVADNVSREFTVTVGKKDPSHPNYGIGHDMGFIVDGVQGEELVLTRGVKYTFLVNTNVQHDFYFTTSPAGRGVRTVTDGIKGQFTYRGVVTFTPTASTPAELYYECRNHSYMGGKIHVVNAGDKVTINAESSPRPAVAADHIKVTEAEVKQKLSYAELVINSSAPVKRVEASDNFQAKRLMSQAREQLDSARSALAAADTAAAMKAVNEALRLMSAATRLVPDEAVQTDYKTRYSELLDQVHGFDKSYQKNLARGVTPKSGKALDKAEFDRLMQESEGLAAKERYADAVKPLQSANDMLTVALSALLESQTVVYDKNFATPKEEYEFELSRYGSYEELIPLAIEQRKPSEQTVGMMDVLVKRAKEIKNEAIVLAFKGDHKQAIMALQAATERLQRALRMAGVQ